MSTWFHNYRTKIVNCPQCGKMHEIHEESIGKSCLTCLKEVSKKALSKIFKEESA
jgi:endogenous inhibitor of DNA gyrase (YacG/DUF329 family)